MHALNKKSFHLGFGKSVTRSNLSKVNEKRDSRIFEDYAFYLIDIARKKRSNNDFEIKGKVSAFDSSTIDLCFNVFWWAKFRKAKAGIKIHTLFDITTQIPALIHIMEASVNDMNAMDVIPYKYGAYCVFDRGYVDYKRLFNITNHSAYFVIRAKRKLQFNYNQLNEVNEWNGVMSDQIGKLTDFYISQYYPDDIPKVVCYDKETNRTFVYLTNNMTITSEQVALLYKNRWQVELYFKWIKTTFENKVVLGNNRKRCLYPNILCNHNILLSCNCRKRPCLKSSNL